MFKKVTKNNIKFIDVLKLHSFIIKSHSLDILYNIHIKNISGKMYLSSTNNEQYLITNFENSFEDFEFLVNFKYFYDIIKNYKDINKLELKDNILNINDEFNIQVNKNISYFPVIDYFYKENIFNVNSDYLIKHLNCLSLFVAQDDLKPAFNSIKFEFGESDFLIATDSRRLSFKEININKNIEEDIEFLIPLNTIKIINNIFKNKKENLNVKVDKDKIQFESNNIVLISKLIDSGFPNWRQVIPEEFLYSFKILKENFRGAIKKSLEIKKENNNKKVVFEIIDNKLKLIAINKDDTEIIFESFVNIIKKKISTENVKFALNAGFVNDILKVLDIYKEDIIEIKGDEETSPILINDNYVIMPIKI